MSTASDLASSHSFAPTFNAQTLHNVFFPDGYRMRLACAVLIVYDYLLTFEAERRMIWSRKLIVPTALFLFNRYCLILLGLSMSLWFFVSYDDDGLCRVPSVLQHLFAVCVGAVGTVFQALRIHCINNRNWFWTSLLLVLGFVPTLSVLIDMIVTHSVALPSPLTGCLGSKFTASLNGHLWTRVTAAIILTAYIPDVIVIVITWYRTARMASAARGVDLGRTSIVYLLLRDGTTYFVAGLMVDSVIVYYVLARQVALSEIGLTMWSILMSRFILDLRQTADLSTGVSTSMSGGPSAMSSIRFASNWFDNLGAPLDLDSETERVIDNGMRMRDMRVSRQWENNRLSDVWTGSIPLHRIACV